MTQMTTLESGIVPHFDQSDRLGKALRHSGVSVQEMAHELDVSRNTVGNYISGRRTAPRSVLIVWALRTGVPLTWLQTGEAPTDDGPGPDLRARRDSNPQPSGMSSPVTDLREYAARRAA